MRILLTANASYVPPRGGATRSNLIWLEHLASAGHSCRVVCATLPRDATGKLEQLRDEQIGAPKPVQGGIEVVERDGLAIYAAPDPAARGVLLRDQVREFQPDWVLVSSEDVGQLLLREAHELAPGRVVFIAHTPQFFPFGPASWAPDPHGAELVAQAAGIVAIGHHMAEYIERYAGRRPAVVHPPIYGEGPYRNLGSFDRGLVTMINPSAVKGISIFLGVAAAMPDLAFGALPGWGTTKEDRAALERYPNITVLPNARDIERVLEKTRVLLMPSLWYEGFGLIVMEAMLRGIPVIASDSGGLVEAKMGTGFVIPVRGIERYEPEFDEHAMPKPVLSEQDITPWIEALRNLLSDRGLYEDEAGRSREAALRFVGGLRAGQMEDYLASLAPAAAGAAPHAPHVSAQLLETLSPEKRALLLQRLKKKTAGQNPPR